MGVWIEQERFEKVEAKSGLTEVCWKAWDYTHDHLREQQTSYMMDDDDRLRSLFFKRLNECVHP